MRLPKIRQAEFKWICCVCSFTVAVYRRNDFQTAVVYSLKPIALYTLHMPRAHKHICAPQTHAPHTHTHTADHARPYGIRTRARPASQRRIKKKQNDCFTRAPHKWSCLLRQCVSWLTNTSTAIGFPSIFGLTPDTLTHTPTRAYGESQRKIATHTRHGTTLRVYVMGVSTAY